MRFIGYLPDTLKGILLIIAGALLLFDTLGFATQIVHTIVIIGAITLIIVGIYLANIHTFFQKLFTKKDEQPPYN